ncbi:apotyrosinase chaperone MelC1 [Streptomyces glomeratus]|uniref:Tyrosinase n=1 Tax=Streptomyces glomeratus TaxID=284452 RepID=A0ABP6LDV0_9ACTN|nr:tyrosinase cofactor [Streptomyces glomeratus]MCF1511007.1 tyrosinase cofactor [Streptomyces glomeratus]
MPELTRRRALVAGAAVAAAGGLATQAASASATTSPSAAPASAGMMPGHDHGEPAPFDEVYRGRRIEGRPTAGGHHGSGYGVFIDGVELHVMQNADGSWISVVSHYDPVPTPRAAARAAVVELQGAPLVPFN